MRTAVLGHQFSECCEQVSYKLQRHHNSFTGAKYTNENALDYDASSPINRTKVIVKGQLCKADGSNFTIVRHLGAHFADTYSETPTDNLPALKANILSQLTANGYNYYSGMRCHVQDLVPAIFRL